MTSQQHRLLTNRKVGGGPSGLVLALALAQNGVQVRIIEKNTSFHAAQRGSGIQPRSLELFKFLGVLPDIWAGSRWNNPSAIYKMPEGKEIAKIVDMTPYVEPTPDVPFVSTFQWPFQQKSGALTGSEEIASHHRPISYGGDLTRSPCKVQRIPRDGYGVDQCRAR